ncbi:hypothetical protein [Aquimarina pacifica]|uniref:hypothetical protein n=1 Tax=Aquimarina pacifica TaxID=1296415 RepID=UPI0004719C00|nr:hypothetical protein [Aquimarina pacifica]
MKRTFLLMALCTSSLFYAQEKIPYVDYEEIIEDINAQDEKQEYDKIIAGLDKISVNDSIYESTLITKSYYLMQQKKYDEAIVVCDQGLQLPMAENQYSFLLNKGLALIESEKYKDAIAVHNEALKIYPRNNIFYHNLGFIYKKTKQFDKAAQNYMKSITLNPFYEKSHLELGRICYQEGKIAQALMAFNMYLLLNPDGENSFDLLNSVNTLVSNQNDLEPAGIQISADDYTFEDIDLVLDSRMALNVNYKIDNKINIALTKQNHALFEQLSDYEGDGGFWDKKYVPFYQWVFQNNHFDNFTYTISYSIQNPDFKKIIDKNIDDVKSFVNLYYSKWEELMSYDHEEVFEGKKQKVTYLFDNYTFLQAVGVTNGEKKIGNWEIYDEEGKIIGKGKFDDSGLRNGEWIWYDQFGNISEKENYKNGKLEGKYTSYYTNGNIEIESFYEGDRLNGDYKAYNKSGALGVHKVFENGTLNGRYLTFYALGEISKEYEVNYTEGIPTGELKQYYPDGSLLKKRPFKNGKINGIEQVYYNTGESSAEYEYKDDYYNGVYRSFYPNGQPYEVGTTSEGYYNGDWKFYYSDGTLMRETAYSEGKFNGSYKEYDVDGKLISDFTYRNDDFIAHKHFNKNGEVIQEAKKKNGEFYYQGFSPLGDMITEGLYDSKGGKKGEWKYYTDGVLINKGVYEDNLLQGAYYSYYRSGQEESIAQYKNDSLSGYYVGYHENGNIARQGWHKNNKAHGFWISYYNDGKIKEKNFYHKGKQHGIQEIYGVEGKLSHTLVFEYQSLVSEVYFRPDGSVQQEIAHDPTKKTYTISFYRYDGTVYSKTAYLYGLKHGTYIQFDHEGKKTVEGAYFNDKYHGKWTWYNESKISLEGEYFHGENIGEWKIYHDTGKLHKKYTYESGQLEGILETYDEQGVLIRTIPYKKGKIHGERMFYSPEGKLQAIRYYHNDKIIGYSYHDTNGDVKPMIPIENYSGQVRAFFDNGKPSMEAEFKNGLLVEDFKAYYYSGQLERQTSFINGNTHGKFIDYYADGKIKSETNYNYDMLHGMLKEYYQNGNLKKEVNYLYDKRSGSAKYFDENGKLKKENVYFNDIVDK